ncbi:hypothetical protein K402DRAFT_225777 [Aulographum hederae CBS 113979]|uniref:LicD/FKTN/FKRP nucleotidyltransferase domain-containing protein n=1 Tax=Aulographum hederae CBS 113979 TaxID=1176131 RepID=A0A6G1HB78_9PEZI|nr:hypothetical protein K402DRAFT_225777 [Aulographum hederae CBS 113979]
MRLRFFLSCILLQLLDLVVHSSSSPLSDRQKRDADFASVRNKLSRDHSGRKGDPPGKYFHESTFHPHYDGRFASIPLPDEDRHKHLRALMRTYLATMTSIGAETWIMHGTLLGWWWNRKIMPWDTDVDVQISESSMRFLADFYNMTMHHFKLPGISMEKGRSYLLEVNPNWRNGSTADTLNMIDARWIDTDTGLYIDITTLRRDTYAEEKGLKGRMMCKDKHHYLAEEIFPLRTSVFEGVEVRIPFMYTRLLEEEYGARSLVNRHFDHYYFNERTMDWEYNGRPGGRRGRPDTDVPGSSPGPPPPREKVLRHAGHQLVEPELTVLGPDDV